MTRGGPPAWGLGMGLATPHRKKIRLLCIFYKSLGLGEFFWINNLINGIWTIDLGLGM
jgi:hypothetical protein